MIDKQVAENVEAIIRQAADEIVCPYFRNLEDHSIKTKTTADDIVTIADIKSEDFLTANLTKTMRDSVVLGEEAYYKQPDIKSCLHGEKPVWIIDPIDGTANYAQGNPIFGLIVSLVMKGQTMAGWMFDPLQDRMFFSQSGQGVLRNGEAMTAFPKLQREMSEMTGCLGRRKTDPFLSTFSKLIRSGCSAHDYMSICEGDLDFRYFKSLHPWDHAAGVLMVQELGGCARLMDTDTDYTPVFHNTNTMLVAQNEGEWQSIHPILK